MAAKASSQIFVPFRSLGFVANHVPLALQTLGKESFVTTAVGNAFHLYNVSWVLVTGHLHQLFEFRANLFVIL